MGVVLLESSHDSSLLFTFLKDLGQTFESLKVGLLAEEALYDEVVDDL